MKRIFSGIQPSGNLHIGNYLGAIKNWVKLQNDFESIFCIVDLHAITVPQKPEELKKRVLEVAKIYLASGINIEKSSIFIQSHVQEHTELRWILNTIARNGELKRMTQFKDKAGIADINSLLKESLEKVKEYNEVRAEAEKIFFSKDVDEKIKAGKMKREEYDREILKPSFFKYIESADAIQKSAHLLSKAFMEDKKAENVGVGLFDYPVLMAADILLYDTEKVPVGEDQVQHVELTRTLGKRFNSKFGETFVIPEPYITKEGMRIMGLDDPTKKMSKSATSEYNWIALTDEPDAIRKKIKKAVTDSGSEIKYQDEKPALKNLINIYSGFSGKSPKEIEVMYVSKGYGDLKNDLAEVIIAELEPIQKKMKALSDEEVLKILQDGANKVRPLAQKKMKEVKEKIGFIS